MIAVQPSASFEAIAQFDTGLTGTLGVRIIDNAGATVTARATAGIAEYPAGSGIYQKTLTAPATVGQYTLVWDDTENFASDELLVTGETTDVVVPAPSNVYVTRTELKAILGLVNETFSDAAIDIAVEAASRCCDGYARVPGGFYPTTATRLYTGDRYDPWIATDDLITVTAVTVDADGDGTFETTWAEGTDFYLDPTNAALDARPSRRLVLRSQANRRFPRYPRSIQVEGQFGWATTPIQVKQATILLANRFLTRTGQAPLGILVAAASDAVTTARLGRIDPDVALLLDEIPGLSRPGLVSIQLG